MNFVISGLTAAGKTTHSRLLAQQLGGLGYTYLSASSLLLDKFNIVRDAPKRLPDYWISDEALALNQRRLEDPTFDQEVDRSLVDALEQGGRHLFVADVLGTPWLAKKRHKCVWLESSLKSRTMKAIVSYRGVLRYSVAEIERRIHAKDVFDHEYFARQYGIDLFGDRGPFDYVFDISEFIAAPTDEASRQSVSRADEMLSFVVDWEFQRRDEVGLSPELRERIRLSVRKAPVAFLSLFPQLLFLWILHYV